MPKMPVMEAVIDILEDEGVRYIFGIPGAGILPFYKALEGSKKITHLLMRHEEGATHAADGYARASGEVGVCVGTSGPAGTNMVTGLYAARVDSIPIIAITGQNVRAQLGKEAFQAVDIAEIVKPITKKSYCVKETAQLPQVFREAFRIAREGRPGPVLIDLPLDVQRGEVYYDAESDGPLEIFKPGPNPKKVRRALEMILEARNPVFILGGGVIWANACEELVKLAEYLAVPVVTTLMGKGGIRPDHPLYAGQVGVFVDVPPGNRVFLESDLVVGFGCRFSDRHTGALDVYTKGRRFIHVNIEPDHIGRIVPADLAIVADVGLTLRAMLEEAKRLTPRREPSQRVKEIPELRKRLSRRMDFDEVPIKPQRVFKEINEFFDEDTIFVTTIGLNQMLSSQLQNIYKPRHYLVPGGAGPLGWDLPASIGAKLARPENLVVDITGDYGFGFCVEELAVAVMYEVPVVFIILNDGHLGLIRQTEKYVYQMHFAVDTWYTDRLIGYPRLIDFVKLAEAFGAIGERVEKPEELRGAFERAVKANHPYVIDVIIHRETDVSTGTSIDAIVERY
ncbi:glyoxylate carboligase [Candidatus Bathyarchaeota archaeon]|nr:glyoxylate carboligase [Candidatus Bathyarchaeota archaeon]MBS7627785.1 glyoxylate carboligase [Candidatus Bathyarchaeota archaeon]